MYWKKKNLSTQNAIYSTIYFRNNGEITTLRQTKIDKIFYQNFTTKIKKVLHMETDCTKRNKEQ